MTTDERSTTQKIADLLTEQTYDERMKMAEWLSDAFEVAGATDKGFIAALLGDWAEDNATPEASP